MTTANLRHNRRARLWVAQAGRCHWCRRFMTPHTIPGPHQATFEHILPRARGGTDSIANLALACFSCNNLRGDTHPWEPPDPYLRTVRFQDPILAEYEGRAVRDRATGRLATAWPAIDGAQARRAHAGPWAYDWDGPTATAGDLQARIRPHHAGHAWDVTQPATGAMFTSGLQPSEQLARLAAEAALDRAIDSDWALPGKPAP